MAALVGLALASWPAVGPGPALLAAAAPVLFALMLGSGRWLLALPGVVFVVTALVTGLDAVAASRLEWVWVLAALLLGYVGISAGARYVHWPAGGLVAPGCVLAGSAVFTVVLVCGSSATGFGREWMGAVVPAAMGAFALAHGWAEQRVARRLRSGAKRSARVSVMMIVHNEADRLATSLPALVAWADEVVILDSGSTDGSQALARSLGAQVHDVDWPGYGEQKQRGLGLCSCEWVLSIDADERPGDELLREIDLVLSRPTAHAGFRMPWVSQVFGKPVYFGADGRYHRRLVRREQARFDGASVHEDVRVSGTTGTLLSFVWHDTFRDYRHLMAKFADYAWLATSAKQQRGRRSTLIGAFVRALAGFVLLLVYRAGILDGRRGLLMAAVYAIYTFNKYAGLWAQSRPGAETEAGKR